MTRKECLDKALECVNGQREQDYGTPESNFSLIADFWSIYLDHTVTAHDVAMMMALLKIARIKNGGGTGDSFVDLAGYAACGAEINSEPSPTKGGYKIDVQALQPNVVLLKKGCD